LARKSHNTSPAPKRNEYLQLVKPVVEFFEKRNLPVIAKREKNTGRILYGSDEFGVSPTKGEIMRVDAVAFEWGADGRVVSKAVEAKLYQGSPAQSVGYALRQAASYQVLFNEVYVAVEKGEIGYHESILSDLGLGLIFVDNSSNVEVQLEPKPSRRFSMEECRKQVVPRLVPPLAFIDVFGQPVKFGLTRDGQLYAVKELADPKLHIQFNAGVADGEKARSYIGFNLEHKNAFRAILRKKPDEATISRMLKELVSNGYEVSLVKVPTPHPKNARDEPIKLTDKTNANEIFRKVKPVLKKDSGFRPHLAIYKEFLQIGQDIGREEALQSTREAVAEISRLSSYVCELLK